MIFSYHRLVNTCTAHAAIGSVISMAGKNEIPAHPRIPRVTIFVLQILILGRTCRRSSTKAEGLALAA
jgi:hypothetical protein